MFSLKKAIISTLGCRLNHADTALLTSRLYKLGYEVVPENTPNPDLILINTCAVTQEASAKSRRLTRRWRKLYPNAKIIALGCASKLNPDDFLSSGANLAGDNPTKRHLAELLEDKEISLEDAPIFKENTSSSFPFRSRAFIKIQEGCNNWCTYCIVPALRGPEKSRNFTEAINDCKQALDNGFSEIVLTGVNTCAYNDNGKLLSDLIYEIASLPGDFRIRLSSTEPHPANKELVDVIASEKKICRFLHLSLQHGSDRILEKMNRHYTTEEYASFISYAREKIPGIHLGTDIIVGFPGETDEDFEICYNFAKQMQFANTHLFRYSPRPGTVAATYKNLPPGDIVNKRFAKLQTLSEESAYAFAMSQNGIELPVIYETCNNGYYNGWSDNYLPFHTKADDSITIGKICMAKFDVSYCKKFSDTI